MHVANGLTAFLFVRKHGKKVSAAWLGLWLLSIFSTIYLGEHYWQDAVAGCFYSLIPYLFVTRMFRKASVFRGSPKTATF
jgi:membrane-associated phospholipid phosphatase